MNEIKCHIAHYREDYWDVDIRNEFVWSDTGYDDYRCLLAVCGKTKEDVIQKLKEEKERYSMYIDKSIELLKNEDLKPCNNKKSYLLFKEGVK